MIEALDAAYDEFLSTPSGWRATLSVSIVVFSPTLFLSTPSGWRATRAHYIINRQQKISIHALRVEGDRSAGYVFLLFIEFLSTPSGWRATSSGYIRAYILPNFYPRPPGGGRQPQVHHIYRLSQDFYPRPPGGGRLKVSTVKAPHTYIFLSTPSGWRATSTVREILHNVHTFLSTPSGWRAT